MNLPNKITISRICLLPVFMIVMLVPEWGSYQIGEMSIPVAHFWGTVIFAVAAITDWIDGHLARKNNLVTNLGKFLDPLADKLLVGIALLVLVDLHYTPVWVAAVIIAREFAVTGLRLVLAGQGEVVAAAMLGKIKTWVQMFAIVFCLLGNFPFEQWGIPMDAILMYLAVFFTVWSGWDIFWVNRHIVLASK